MLAGLRLTSVLLTNADVQWDSFTVLGGVAMLVVATFLSH